MPLLVKRDDGAGNEEWMCGNCFGFVAPAEAIAVPVLTPSGKEVPIPHCVPCVDRVDFNVKGP